MVIRDFKDLLVWQKAKKLAIQVYKLTKKYPAHEKFGIVNQIRRAAVSIASNISEGHGRKSTKEDIRFLRIAGGSIAELENQIIISGELEYISAAELNEIIVILKEVQMMQSGLVNSLMRKLNSSIP